MNDDYETKRLILRILTEDSALAVLAFCRENKDSFEPYERIHPKEYDTVSYQEQILRSEEELRRQGKHLRYYLFAKEEPEKIIGTVNFMHLVPDRYGSSCQVAYKLDHAARGRGYMTEALVCLIPQVSKQYHLRQINAYIREDNVKSRHVAERVGFTEDGTYTKTDEIARKEEPHICYKLRF